MPVIIRRSLNSFGFDVVIYEEHGNERVVAAVNSSGQLVFTEYKQGAAINPTFTINDDTMKEIIVEAANLDIRTEEESTIRGKHAAQTAHMLDLQNIIGWFMNGQKPVKVNLRGGGKVTQLPFGMPPFIVDVEQFMKP